MKAKLALHAHTPEFVPTVRELAARFGIAGVAVEANGERVEWSK